MRMRRENSEPALTPCRRTRYHWNEIYAEAQRAVFVVTTGAWKQTVVRVALFSEPTTEYPVTLFPRYVPECVLYCDRVPRIM